MRSPLRAFKSFIEQAVSREIDRRLADVKKVQPKAGYHPLEHIKGAMFHWVLIPFNGIPVWCFLRCLNQTQLEACGGVNLVEAVKDVSSKEPNLKDIIKVRNIQENIVKETLISPSFDEIMGMIGLEDAVYSAQKKEVEELRKIDPAKIPQKERKQFLDRLDALELSIAFLLPEDAMGTIVSWALGTDVTDIKKITDDILVDAATLATRGNDNPSDHIAGCFTDRDKPNIDKAAWGAFASFMERHKGKQGNGKRWVGGGK